MTREEKQKAIDALKISAPVMAVTQEEFNDYIHILNQVMDWLEQEPKWIPVSERLPNNHEYIKNNGLFNVSDGNRSYSEWFDIYDTEKFGEPTITGFRVDYAVTAWMPLPQPYKAESGEI